MKLDCDTVSIGGIDGFDNPLISLPYPKKDYAEGKKSARISFRSIWLNRYGRDANGRLVEFRSCNLELLSNGKCFLDGKELKRKEDIDTAKEIFTALKISD